MARIPKRLAGPLLVDLTDETIYTVPALTKTVIRHIHISNPTGGAVTYRVSIGATATATRILDNYSVAAGATYDLYGMFVMDVGEILQVGASADDTTTITVNGDEIVLG